MKTPKEVDMDASLTRDDNGSNQGHIKAGFEYDFSAIHAKSPLGNANYLWYFVKHRKGMCVLWEKQSVLRAALTSSGPQKTARSVGSR